MRFMILLLLCLPLVTAEDLPLYFQEQAIPVTEVVAGETVHARYNVVLMRNDSSLDYDIPYIMGTLAGVYSESEEIVITCYVGEQDLHTYSLSTDDIYDYHEGRSGTLALYSKPTSGAQIPLPSTTIIILILVLVIISMAVALFKKK